MQVILYADTPQEVLDEFVQFLYQRAEHAEKLPGRTKREKERDAAVARAFRAEADWFRNATVLPKRKP